jgi:hypothetical protein
VAQAKGDRRERPQVPVPTLATVFEVVAEGKVYLVKGAALQRWILKRRDELNGPVGMLFRKRPTIE